jgi:hypothetical protein
MGAASPFGTIRYRRPRLTLAGLSRDSKRLARRRLSVTIALVFYSTEAPSSADLGENCTGVGRGGVAASRYVQCLNVERGFG